MEDRKQYLLEQIKAGPNGTCMECKFPTHVHLSGGYKYIVPSRWHTTSCKVYKELQVLLTT